MMRCETLEKRGRAKVGSWLRFGMEGLKIVMERVRGWTVVLAHMERESGNQIARLTTLAQARRILEASPPPIFDVRHRDFTWFRKNAACLWRIV